MSVFVQSVQTGKYAQGPASWTDDPREAQNFAGGTAAILFCYLHHLRDICIVGQFTDSEQNFRIAFRQSDLD